MYTSEKAPFKCANITPQNHILIRILVESRDAQRLRSNRNDNVDVNVT